MKLGLHRSIISNKSLHLLEELIDYKIFMMYFRRQQIQCHNICNWNNNLHIVCINSSYKYLNECKKANKHLEILLREKCEIIHGYVWIKLIINTHFNI